MFRDLKQRFLQSTPLRKARVRSDGVFDYRLYLPVKNLFGHTKKALISYSTAPVIDEVLGKDEIMFSNRGLIRSIPRALNELGYVVDVVSFDDINLSLQKNKYDLLIQHGAVNYDIVRPSLKKDGKMIYFSTGSYWKYHNTAEKARFNKLRDRTGAQLAPDRIIEVSEERVNSEAEGIIALGNENVRSTYKKFPTVLTLNLACYPDQRSIYREPSITQSNFLFYAGGGAVHKGLDLVIEAFSGLNENLYIVAHADEEFKALYSSQLTQPNIHYMGNLHMRSEEYYKIFDKCSFAILPSCSEGQPGSIIECLNEGIIPIVTKDVNLDVEDFGFLIQPSVEAIEEVVNKTRSLTPHDIKTRSNKARQTALTNHSPEGFISSFKSHVQAILEAE